MNKVDRYVQASTRKKTTLSYQAAVRHFEEEWGGYLPATTDSIARYLADHAETLAMNTLKLRLAGLAQWHRDYGFADPTKSPLVKKVLKGIREIHPAQEKQAKPLHLAQLTQAVAWLETNLQQAVATNHRAEQLRFLRDRALVLIGFWRAFRSDELSRLCVQHVEVDPGKGMTLYLSRSKTDKQSNGKTYRAPALKQLCPVTAYQEWINAAGLESGPVFRSIDRWGHIAEEGLNSTSIIPLLRRILRGAGVADAEHFSSHSLRRGFATWANGNGWDLKTLMGYVGWNDVKSAMRYIDGNAALQWEAI